MKKIVYSFDVFDTLITRAVAFPSGIFALMNDDIKTCDKFQDLPDILKQEFYNIRSVVEQFVRTNKNLNKSNKDVSIYDIYNYIAYNYDLSEEEKNNLIELEIKLELENILPVNKNIEKLKKLKLSGKHVILITDMYLPSNVIRDLLMKCDRELFKDITIYVSNEYNARKNNGDLYQIVKEKENIESYEDWYHFGDNYFVDIENALKFGIKAEHYLYPKLNSYEYDLLSKRANSSQIQLLLGISHYCRVCYNKIYNEKFEFGTSFLTPVLYLYVKNIIDDCIKNNRGQIFFMARDGYILKKIADIIISKNNLDIETRYFYGSRKALRLPIKENCKDFINLVFSEYTDLFSINFLAERLNIESDYLLNIFNFKDKNKNKKLKKEEIIKLKDFLLADYKIQEDIIFANKSKVELLKKYIIQEIDFNKKAVFVDSNGYGATIDILEEIIHSISPKYDVIGWFLPLGVRADLKRCSKKSPIIFTEDYGDIIELFLRCYEGQTIGYKEEAGKIVPITENINNTCLKDWGFDDYLEGILSFTRIMVDYEQKNRISSAGIVLFKFVKDYLTNTTDKKIANIIGSIPFASIGSENKVLEFAPKYKISDILCNKFSYCHNISLVRTSKFVKFVYKYRNQIFKVCISRKNKTAYLMILGIKISFSKLLFLKYKNKGEKHDKRA